MPCVTPRVESSAVCRPWLVEQLLPVKSRRHGSSVYQAMLVDHMDKLPDQLS